MNDERLAEVWRLESESVSGTHSGIFGNAESRARREYAQLLCELLVRVEQGDSAACVQLQRLLNSGEITRDMVRKCSAVALGTTTVVWQRLMKQDKYGDNPLVSVVILVYNGEATLAATIESVLNQTYANLEIIIADDCSTDHSREVIESYTDSRIRPLYSECNRGICGNSNRATSLMRGKYYTLIAQDDLWKPDKIEKQVSFMEEHPSYAQCFARYDVINEQGEIINDTDAGRPFYPPLLENYPQHEFTRLLFERGNRMGALTAMLRADIPSVRAGYRYSLIQNQDFDLWLRSSLYGGTYIFGEKLASYRRFTQGTNLSDYSMDEVRTQLCAEEGYLRNVFINQLNAAQILDIFPDCLPDEAKAHLARGDESDLRCARAWIAHGFGLPDWFGCIADLICDDVCRGILTRDYRMTTHKYLAFDGVSLCE